MTGRLIAVVGPSGVGKDTVMAALAAATSGLGLVRRVITRPADAGGEAFHGVTDAVFDDMRRDGAFALWWGAHGLRYGVPATVDTDLRDGRDLLVNLSRAVLPEARRRFDRFAVLSLTATPEVLATRLRARGREDAAQITARLARASTGLPEGVTAVEIDNSGPLDHTVQAAIRVLYPVKA